MYDNNLDNQHKATWKFARRWFGPYVVTSANDNATYHIADLDGTRIAVPVTGKLIKAFRKWYEGEPDPDCVGEGDDPERTDEGGGVDASEDDNNKQLDFLSRSTPFLGTFRSVCGFGGGGCREENQLQGEKGPKGA